MWATMIVTQRKRDVQEVEPDQQCDADEQSRDGDRQEEQQQQDAPPTHAEPRQAIRGRRGEDERAGCDTDRDDEAVTHRVEECPRAEVDSYQRSENPVNGNESELLSWNENSTTITRGRPRNSRVTTVTIVANGLRVAVFIRRSTGPGQGAGVASR